MRNDDLFKWLTPVTLGLSMLCPTAALASEPTVVYTPGPSFTFNPSTGNTNIDFGTVDIQSDSATGWVLRVRSTKGGTLDHGTHPFSIPYTLTVNGLQVGNLADGNDVLVFNTSTLTCPSPIGCTWPVRASAVASDIATKPAGSYSDELVFTLVNQ